MAGLLLAALLFAGEGSWDADPETPACTPANYRVIEATLPNILVRELRTIPSKEGAEACGFLAGHANLRLVLSFRDKDRAARAGGVHNPNPDAPMAYDRLRRSIALEHRLLHLDGRDESVFIRSPEAQKALAEAVGFSFVHELSHTRERERQPGQPGLAEDELAAFYRSFLFLADALQGGTDFDRIREAARLQRRAAALFAAYDIGRELPRGPEEARAELQALEGRYREVVNPVRLLAVRFLAALADSNARFEAGVNALYARQLPSVGGPPGENAAAARGKLEKLRAGLREFTERGGRPGPEDEGLVREFQGDVAFWESAAKIVAAKRRYDELLAGLRREADDARRAGKLEAFKISAEEARGSYAPRFRALQRERASRKAR